MNPIRHLRCLLAALLIITLTGCTLTGREPAPTTEPLQDSAQIPTLLLDNKPFKPEPGPVVMEGKLYLPFSESLALLNIQPQSYTKSDALIAYHDNRFLRINTETLQITQNGKNLPKAQAALMIEGTIYVPSNVIFDSFNLSISYPKDGVISIIHRDNLENSQLIDGDYYVPIAVKEFDLQFHVPKSWSRLPGSPYRFGESTDFDDYQITFLTTPMELMPDSELLQKLAKEAGAQAGVELFKDQVSPLQVNGLEGLTATYRYDKNNTGGRMTLYLFKRDDVAYIFQGWINTAIDEQTVMRQITGIARSLRFGDMVVDVQREHYIEAPTFYDDGFTLAGPLYSNMEVRGQIELTGTLTDKGIDWLYVAVTRGGETLTQKFPIKDKTFSATVHTPFGLGKHDLTVYASKNEPHPQDRILQVSVVNINSLETRWMIPSPLVNSDNDYITSQSSLLTYKTYGDYMKARQLFSYVVETIRLNPSQRDPRSASDIYLKEAGSEQEIAILYAALLRATEIPARIVTGTSDSLHTWVEMQMNGQWVESDPTAAIIRMKNGAPLQEATDGHFNMSRSYFEEKHTGIETVSW